MGKNREFWIFFDNHNDELLATYEEHVDNKNKDLYVVHAREVIPERDAVYDEMKSALEMVKEKTTEDPAGEVELRARAEYIYRWVSSVIAKAEKLK